MILAVAGGKGGVGKSTVAFNLGHAWDAVVVDADLSMANLPTTRGPDLHDVLAGRAEPIEAVREGSVVNILPCGRTLAGARACEPPRLVKALAEVASTYERVVVDCPAGMAVDAGLSLLAADAYLLVTTPDRAAVADALRTRSLARWLGTGLGRVVLNRVGKRPPKGAIREVLGAPVVAIPDDENLARAQAHGQPIEVVEPNGVAARRFRELADATQSCRS